MPPVATSLNTWAIAIAAALDARGIDSEALFVRARMDPAILRDPNGRYSVVQMGELWRLAVETSSDPCLGIHAAEYVQPATFHSLGLAVLASLTLEDALMRSARYSRIVSNAAEVSVEETSEGLVMRIEFRKGLVQVDEDIDLFMAANVKMGRLMTGREILPRRLRLRRRATAEMAREFEGCFGACLQFEAGENSLLISREDARRPLPMANAALASRNDRMLMEQLAVAEDAGIAARVRAELILRLPGGEPARGDIAAALHLSEKTLQRRLSSEQTSFQDVLDETRRDLAQQYLRDEKLPVGEVTFRLGFSDQSSFTRAFKRWTGSSPGEFRSRNP